MKCESEIKSVALHQLNQQTGWRTETEMIQHIFRKGMIRALTWVLDLPAYKQQDKYRELLQQH